MAEAGDRRITRFKVFSLAAIGASVVALASYLVSAFVPSEYHAALFLSFSAVLWTISAAIAIQRPPILHLTLIVAGLSWGFFITHSVVISVQNGRVSVMWGPFLAALTLAPPGVLISLLPFWALGKRILNFVSLAIASISLIIVIFAAHLGVLPFVYQGPTAPPGKYDLAAWRVEFSPNPAKVGDLLRYSYTVKNVGPTTIPARTYDVEFYIDGRKVDFDYATHELKPEQEYSYFTSLKDSLKASEEGTHNYKLIVEPKGRLKETDKKNNTLEGSFTVVR